MCVGNCRLSAVLCLLSAYNLHVHSRGRTNRKNFRTGISNKMFFQFRNRTKTSNFSNANFRPLLPDVSLTFKSRPTNLISNIKCKRVVGHTECRLSFIIRNASLIDDFFPENQQKLKIRTRYLLNSDQNLNCILDKNIKFPFPKHKISKNSHNRLKSEIFGLNCSIKHIIFTFEFFADCWYFFC